ncbi:hypothetical protein [Pseudoduganella umbonata]|uniref:Uncharacterized protein n=1 Tax=Pseudoduganella umbonata TaxID=864828 RepID=A0A4V1ECX5_9BURK|nr:hypothetical protein [Pseudoduganella umbonata]MBB3221672.1 hypothetical protein [Pseudoduganella umbonata]QCP09101.1 hypothetical protein FCL38_00600 [Pseudoduganella umbonata]
MDETFDTAMPYRLAQLDLDDDQMLYAAAYMQGAESLATIRHKVVVYNLLLLIAAVVSARIVSDSPQLFGSMRYLFDIIEHVAPALAVLAVLATLIGEFLLNRQLAATTLPCDAKQQLRRLASSIDGYVIRRFMRRIFRWIRRH